jgi:hypothetical protein
MDKTVNMTLEIINYKAYLKFVRNWDNHSPAEQEQLRAWYRTYYNDNKERERERYREYYSLHSDSEKERVKKSRRVKKIEFKSNSIKNLNVDN